MKKLIVVLFLFAVSCSKDTGTHLPPKKMQDVLTDIHLAESYSMVLNNKSISNPNAKNIDSLALYYATIFKHHNITKEQFTQSLEWYKRNPEELDSIYIRLIPEFTKLEGIYDKP